MLRVGLTGGIACGKTTVAAMFRELGFPVIEADPLAHQLIEIGQPAYEEVAREFGREILDAHGQIIRAKLGAIVFQDHAKLARLNQIIHPRVIAEVERWADAVERSGSSPLAIIEAALLVESGLAQSLDRLVVVWCRPEQQRQRLRARGLSDEESERRLAAQLPLDEKRRLADDEIDCSGSLEHTREQVEELAAKVTALATERPGHTKRNRA